MSQRTVIGVFENPEEARRASEELSKVGYPREKVDVASRSGEYTDVNYKTTETGDHKEGSAIGRFFRNLFSDDDDKADRYSRVAERSGSVVTVHCHDEDNAERAAEILDRCGAVDVDERASKYGFYNSVDRTNMSSDRGLEDTGTMRAGNLETTGSIPVVNEEMNVSKREVETGGARLRSRIVEQPVEENLRLREEHVFVERKQVNRPANESDLGAFREGTVEMRESAEIPVVNKESRVVEEVSLNKQVEEREETIRGTVRNTEVDVERLDGDRSNSKDSGRSNMSSDNLDLGNDRSGLNYGRSNMSSDDNFDSNDRRKPGFDPDMPGRGI
jgi:stress response protein YsnF